MSIIWRTMAEELQYTLLTKSLLTPDILYMELGSKAWGGQGWSLISVTYGYFILFP